MEIVIIVAIWSVIVKRGIEDIWHVARGNTPQRYKAAKAAGKPGSFGRYRRALVDDTFDGMLRRHNDRMTRRAERRAAPKKPRGAMGRFLGTASQGARREMWRRWDEGWDRREEKLRTKTTRPRPRTDTVPGEVVPNQDERQDEKQDETRDRPQDEPQDRPEPKPTAVPDDNEATVPQNQDEQAAPTKTNQQDETPDGDPSHQQEGPTTMTATTTEITGLDTAIKFCDDVEQVCAFQVNYHDSQSAKATKAGSSYRDLVTYIDQGQAMIAAAGITGDTATQFAAAKDQAAAAAADLEEVARLFAAAKEKAGLAASAMESAKKVLQGFKPGQEFYDAQPDAPDREFLTAGR